MLKKAIDVTLHNRFYTNSSRCVSNLKSEFFNKEADILPKILLSRNIKSSADWKKVREEILISSRQFTYQNIDALTLNYCAKHKKFDLAESYKNFLASENIKPNLATIGKYFKLYYLRYLDNLVSETDEENILALYEELRRTYEVLDSITNEHAILALSVTKLWRKCLPLLDEIKISNIPNMPAYSVTAAAAFRNNDDELAWQLMDEMIENNRIPLDITYLAYLQQINCTLPNDSVQKLDVLLEFLGYHDIRCSKEVSNKICEITKNLNRSSKLTFIYNRGVCGNCNRKLQKLVLSEEEFKRLKEAFFEKVIIGTNVFCKTTPTEVRRFKDFIKNMGKPDVIIDGLNVAYSAGSYQTPQVLSMLLVSVVRHFVEKKKSVLVLGRNHMMKWPRNNLHYIMKNATTFLTENLSHDDPYLLYCALNSGLETILITRDLMRSHLYLLKDAQNRKLFNRWLTQSRYQLLHVDAVGKPTFKLPLPYMITAQKDENYWHIPYEEYSLKDSVNPNNHWMCLKL